MSLCRLAEEVEGFGHQGAEFVGIGGEIVEYLHDRRTKRREGGVVGGAGGVLAQKLPEALNQVEIGRIGREKEQCNAQLGGQRLDDLGALIAGIVQHDQDLLLRVGRPQVAE